MIMLVNCGWRQDDVINKIEAIEVNGQKVFKYLKTTDRIRMYFDSTLPNIEKSVPVAYKLMMDAISKIPGWAALTISVLPVVNGNAFEGYKYTACRPNKPTDGQKLLK